MTELIDRPARAHRSAVLYWDDLNANKKRLAPGPLDRVPGGRKNSPLRGSGSCVLCACGKPAITTCKNGKPYCVDCFEEESDEALGL
jgi:hypothetical protein